MGEKLKFFEEGRMDEGYIINEIWPICYSIFNLVVDL